MAACSLVEERPFRAALGMLFISVLLSVARAQPRGARASRSIQRIFISKTMHQGVLTKSRHSVVWHGHSCLFLRESWTAARPRLRAFPDKSRPHPETTSAAGV